MRFVLKIKKKLTRRRARHADLPLTGAYMSTYGGGGGGGEKGGEDGQTPAKDPTAPQPTFAAFSPNQQTASQRRNQRSVLIHQKSPLLVSTPPQITRALAYSHPYILPLERFAGLVAWRSGDPWESFLLLAVFWFVTLYVDDVLRWAGPVVIVVAMIVGLYTRRYSPLSSTTWTDAKSKRKRADSEARKSLDDILNTLQRFTTNCEACIEPFRQLSEFLSTQSTPTSATTRPALTTLFIRILAFTPFWIVLTLPPFRIITTQRIVLVLGTTALSWHSRYAQICRSILWKSRTVKRSLTFLTGLDLTKPAHDPTRPLPLPPRARDVVSAKGKSPGVRFTFTIYENERRWLGLGWSKQMFSYERQPWTDDHLDECPAPDAYALPATDNAGTRWRWVGGSAWHVEGMTSEREKSAKRIGGGGGGDESGWVYCDSKWQDPRKVDGWSRYTRRRKWIRDAELVEVEEDDEEDDVAAGGEAAAAPTATADGKADDAAETSSIDTAYSASAARKKGWFKARNAAGGERGDAASALSAESRRSRESVEDEDVATPLERIRRFEWDRAYNEDMAPQLS